MADETTNAVTNALREAVDTIAPEIEEGTVLRIGVKANPGDEITYTYAAVYAGGKWHLTGKATLIGSEYRSLNALLTALATFPGFTLELATDFDTIR